VKRKKRKKKSRAGGGGRAKTVVNRLMSLRKVEGG